MLQCVGYGDALFRLSLSLKDQFHMAALLFPSHSCELCRTLRGGIETLAFSSTTGLYGTCLPCLLPGTTLLATHLSKLSFILVHSKG